MSTEVVPAYPTVNPVRRSTTYESVIGMRPVSSLSSMGIRNPNGPITVVNGEVTESKVMSLFPLRYATSTINDGSKIWVKSYTIKLMSARFYTQVTASCGIARSMCNGALVGPQQYLQVEPRMVNFAPILDCLLVDNVIHLLMPYFAGGSIRDLLLAGGTKIDERQVCVWTKDLLLAVQYMQERGIAHYGITADHMLLSNERTIKLSGWSRACSSWDASGQLLLMVKRFRKSARYLHLPPEVFNYEAHDPTQVDRWSVASFVVNCSTKRNAFSPTAGVKYVAQWTTFKRSFLNQNPLLKNYLDISFEISPLKRATLSTCLDHPWLAVHVEANRITATAFAKSSSPSMSISTAVGSKSGGKGTKSKSANRSSKKSTTSVKKGTVTEPNFADPGLSAGTGFDGGGYGAQLSELQVEYESLAVHNNSQEEGQEMASIVQMPVPVVAMTK